MLIGIVGLAILLAFALAGVPLGFAFILIGLAGFSLVRGSWDAGLVMAGQQIFDVATNANLVVIPLFILMGEFIHRARLSTELYDAANALMGHRRGGLAMSTIGACAGFASVCGSSLATAATMSKVAMPSMRRYRYADSLSAGSIAAGGTLGILIPPSVPMVIYGLLAEADIGKLFIAGIVPGILLTLLFIAAIAIQVRFRPELGPPGERIPWVKRWRALTRIWGIVALFIVIIGGIYFGVFTPTEAAGVGAAGAFVFAITHGKVRAKGILEALLDAGRTSGMIFLVAYGALIFSNFINLAGFTGAMVSWLEGLNLPGLGVVLAMCLIYIVLGCVFDSLAMILLTIPIFVPILQPFGVDLIWFGIVVIIVVELGLITPPIGMNVFVVQSTIQDVSVWTVFRGVWPFIWAMLLGLALVIAFPPVATGLVKLM
jgi:tripartite ATP-independent transporter DctM subunit